MEYEEVLTDLEKAERLKSVVMSYATGTAGDDGEYVRVRREFVQSDDLRELLPSFIRTYRNLSEFWGFIKLKFSTYSERRHYIRVEFEPLLTHLEARQSRSTPLASSDVLSKVDRPHVSDAWNKALGRMPTDPSGAITAARTLLETVCKHILDARGIDYSKGEDLPKLYWLAASELHIAPSKDAQEAVNQILAGVQQVVQGVGRLRNTPLSDSHGKGLGSPGANVRIAGLAVNSAGATAIFLVESWEAERNS